MLVARARVENPTVYICLMVFNQTVIYAGQERGRKIALPQMVKYIYTILYLKFLHRDGAEINLRTTKNIS
jgi:hypothetical protein